MSKIGSGHSFRGGTGKSDTTANLAALAAAQGKRVGVIDTDKKPAVFPEANVQARVGKIYNAEVAAVLPHSDEMMALTSASVFVMRYPDHPITATLNQVAARLVA